MAKPNVLTEGEPVTLRLSELPESFTTDALYLRLSKSNSDIRYSLYDPAITALNPHLDNTQRNFLKSGSAIGLTRYLEGNNGAAKDPEIHLPAVAANDPVVQEILSKREEPQPGILATLAAGAGAVLSQLKPFSSAQAAEPAQNQPPMVPPAEAPAIPSIVIDRTAEIRALRDSLPKRSADIENLMYIPSNQDDIQKLPYYLEDRLKIVPAQESPQAEVAAGQKQEPLVRLEASLGSDAAPISENPELEKLITRINGPHTTLSRSNRYKEENKLLQEALIELGYLEATDSKGKSSADGYFGKVTHAAVVKFQQDHGLNDDGKVGNLQTWPTLLKKLSEKAVHPSPEASLGDLAPQQFASTIPQERVTTIT